MYEEFDEHFIGGGEDVVASFVDDVDHSEGSFRDEIL